MMVRYDPYTDSFVDNGAKEEMTATINLNAFPQSIIQRTVEVSDESIEKIADAVARKLADRKTETQTEIPCENCQEWDCYGCDYKQTEREVSDE